MTDPAALAEVRRRLVFVGAAHESRCMCCGQPGMDWYRGDELIAVTTVKHGRAVVRRPAEVVELAPASREWLRAWLLRNGVPEAEMQ